MLVFIGKAIYFSASIYVFILFARVVLDWARVLIPSWTPGGPLLFLADWIYRLTDPPLRELSKVIPPLRLGGIALDVGFIVLFIAVTLLGRVGLWLVRFSMVGAV